MDLGWLHVLHRPKGLGLEEPGSVPGALCIDTCQRTLWVVHRAEAPREWAGEILSGADAYRFLLRVSAGLESRIAGETDVFGQVKAAWKRHVHECRGLGHWMPKVFEDTKEIRSAYLQNVGGASYGSLVRLLLRQLTLAGGPVALLGAGQLARAVAPFLAEGELRLWNRSPGNGARLLEAVARKPGSRVRAIGGDEWAAPGNVAAVLCIPPDPAEDGRRIALWRAGGAERPLLHLGLIGDSTTSAWRALPALHTLEELFALQRSQGEVRSAQLERASQACEEKARLRARMAAPPAPMAAPGERIAFA
jgi:hypothetical protein